MEKFMYPLSPDVGNLSEVPTLNGTICPKDVALIINQTNQVWERINQRFPLSLCSANQP
jgi:hypothetical protein